MFVPCQSTHPTLALARARLQHADDERALLDDLHHLREQVRARRQQPLPLVLCQVQRRLPRPPPAPSALRCRAARAAGAAAPPAQPGALPLSEPTMSCNRRDRRGHSALPSRSCAHRSASSKQQQGARAAGHMRPVCHAPRGAAGSLIRTRRAAAHQDALLLGQARRVHVAGGLVQHRVLHVDQLRAALPRLELARVLRRGARARVSAPRRCRQAPAAASERRPGALAGRGAARAHARRASGFRARQPGRSAHARACAGRVRDGRHSTPAGSARRGGRASVRARRTFSAPPATSCVSRP